jgi:hypothetical protein
LRRSAVPRSSAEVAAPPTTVVRAQPNYRGRSPIFTISRNLPHQLVEADDWLAGRRRTPVRDTRGCQPALSHASCHKLILRQRPVLRRPDLGDDPIAVCYEHGLARGGQAHIFAEPVLQGFEADRAHERKVASRSFFVKVDVGRSRQVAPVKTCPMTESK